MARPGTYLYKRRGSQHWYLRLVYPPELAAELGRPRKEISLGTPERIEAEARAAAHIQEHKIALLAVDRKRAGKPMPLLGELHHRYPANTTQIIDGVRIVATESELLFFNSADDAYLRSERNTVEVSLTNAIEIAMQHPGYFSRYSNGQIREKVARIKPVTSLHRDMKVQTGAIIENWIERRKISKHVAAEAREVAKIFGWITNYRPLPKCNRSDAIKLVQHLESEGNKSKTIEKKLSHLRAALHLAMDDQIFTGVNIFSRLMHKVGHDSTDRLPLSEEDMQLARRHLNELSPVDRLLWIMLATTGMRLSEPFQITEEYESDKWERLRYVIVGTKTPSSKRRVPLPQEVKRLLGSRITGPIFGGSPETCGKRLRRFLQRLNIAYDPRRGSGDRRKTIHSLRHRAADRLREADCPDSIREALLGHEIITVADGYGEGYSIGKLRYWQEKIGF